MKPGLPGNMDERGQRIAWLVAGYIRHTLTETEHDELDDWINESDENMQLFEEWTDDDNIQANLEWLDKVNAEDSYQALKAKGAFKSPQRTWIWSAASITLLVLSAVLIFRPRNVPVKNHFIQTTNHDTLRSGQYRALLEIGNNLLIDLESVPIGKVNAGIEKIQDGMIAYPSNQLDRNSSMHTIRTPVGGLFQIQLSDGTKVWLNASSKLSYSPGFNDSTRSVQLTGEAFFEVAQDSTKPFIVLLAHHNKVRVLGTQFNINSYNSDSSTNISLIEGSLKVMVGDNQQLLTSGEQALINRDRIDKVPIDDSLEIIGWKNGYFIFKESDLQSILPQIERWYGVKTVYRGVTKERFTATIFRNQPLENLLKILEENSRVHFRVENETIYVEQK